MTDEHPTTVDLSPSATKKAVLSYSITNPLTLYSTGVGLLGTLAVGLFGATVLPTSVAIGGVSVGALSWVFNYLLRGDKIAARYAEGLLRQLETHREEVIKKLSKDLELVSGKKDCGRGDDISDSAAQTLAQFRMISQSFESIKTALTEKLKPTEITYSRYVSSAEQVFLAVLDNAVTIASILKTLSKVDMSYIEERLSSLRRLRDPVEEDRLEHKAIEERQQLYETQLSKVNTLITSNEVAITEMDKMCAALSELRTHRGQAVVDLDAAINDMEQLAKRVQNYSVDG